MLSAIIPIYNESEAIEATLNGCIAQLDKLAIEYEIIVIDDGSQDDGSYKAAGMTKVQVVKHLQNKGYGRALKTGIASAKYDTILIMDGDGSYPVEYVDTLLASYQEGYDMVVGARTGKNYSESFSKHLLRLFLKWITQYVTGVHIPDINSGMRVFSKSTISEVLPSLSNAFSFTTSVTLIYLLKGKFIHYLPVPYHIRKGKTKVKLTRDILRTLQFIVEIILAYNPIKLYMLLIILQIFMGTLLFVLGIGLSLNWLYMLGVLLLGLTPVTVAISFLAIQVNKRQA